MGYQTQFKPGKDFSWAVAPYLESLPRAAHQPDLLLQFPLHGENRARWQWYNWRHHHAPQDYTISISRDDILCYFRIAYSRLHGQLSMPDSMPKPERDYIEKLLDEALDDESSLAAKGAGNGSTSDQENNRPDAMDGASGSDD